MNNILFKNSEKVLKERIKLNSEDLHSVLRLADFYALKGKKKKALKFYEKAANEFYLRGKYDIAKGIFKTISILYPEYIYQKEFISNKITQEDFTFTPKEIKNYLKKIELFKDFGEKELEFLEKNSNIVEFKRNDVIVREGERGDSIFVILKGNVKVYVTSEIGKIEEIAILTQGNFFGEMGFFGNGIRKASVDALDDVILLEIPKNSLLKLIELSPSINDILFKYYQERILDLILALSPLFKGLDSKIRKEIIKKFSLKKFKKGELIIKEGEYSDSMFLIKSGEVEVYIEKYGVKKVLSILTEGDFFGEIALLTGQKRTANVIAKTDVEVLELTKKDIDEIMKHHPVLLDVLKNAIQERSADTFQKLMELKRMSAKRGLI